MTCSILSPIRAIRYALVLIALTLPLFVTRPASAGTLMFQSELTTTGLGTFNYEGGTVAVDTDGGTALVAARGYNNFTGRVTVFARSGGAWSAQATLAPADLTAGDAFGTSVAISGDGNTALVGALYKASRSGVVYVFGRSGTIWVQSAVLTAPTPTPGDAFGTSVALSGDGSTAAIGIPNRAVGFNNAVGAVAIFTRTGNGNGPFVAGPVVTPGDGAAYDNFGATLAVNADGGTIAIGAAAKANNAGAVYLFVRNGSAYTGAALPFFPAAGDYFGASIAVSATGGTVLVGAPHTTVNAKSNAGAAYLFTGSGTTYTAGPMLIAADGQSADQFGFAVAISGNPAFTDDAALIAISAPYRNSNVGAVYTLTHGSGTTYTPSQTFEGMYVSGGTQFTFGVGLALNADGTTAIFGAPGKSTSTGTAYVYVSLTASPTVVAISPASGPLIGGTPVTITGTNFIGGATVAFGGGAATNVTRLSATRITAIVPQSTTSAVVDVVFTNGDGRTFTLTRGYEYVTTQPVPPHVVRATVSGMTPRPTPPQHIPAPTEGAMTPTPLPAPIRH